MCRSCCLSRSGKPPWIPVLSTVTSCLVQRDHRRAVGAARNGEITWNLWVTTYRSLGELVISSLRGIVLVARIIALQTGGGRNGPAAQFDARMGISRSEAFLPL